MNTLSDKYAEESVILSFNFLNLLVPDEAVVSATWTSTVKTGVDASASSMIVGSSDTTLDPIVRQRVAAGVKGNSYEIKCVVTTATRTLAHSEVLVIR